MEYFFNFSKLGYLKAKRPKTCILCAIIEGSEDVDRLVVYENEHIIVSLNLYPYNPGHLLLIPRRHLDDIRQMSPAESAEMDDLTRQCLDHLDRLYKPAGYNIGYNQGLAAGGSIEHLHLHIIPRYQNEIGIAELLGGKKVLVQNPLETLALLRKEFAAQGKHDQKGH
ncbi:MAG: HIT domain-containing protein [Spirochaetia bacterium]|nr:HIT domain-containing protein [Spirochaetales bacterium]MDX9784314.1 HIT domain-containing protein [Spirochaetia bacterium]